LYRISDNLHCNKVHLLDGQLSPHSLGRDSFHPVRHHAVHPRQCLFLLLFLLLDRFDLLYCLMAFPITSSIFILIASQIL
jgi:hypothetical protein